MYPLHLPVQDKLLDRAPGAALGAYRGGRREAGLLAAACEAYAGQMGGSLDRRLQHACVGQHSRLISPPDKLCQDLLSDAPC